ncbi:hypothetical protein C8R43DRAFT_1199179 [Mycena crocata]|nr:hypothetical protein C8R43DRAFT_1199179 [Mycena crocata]
MPTASKALKAEANGHGERIREFFRLAAIVCTVADVLIAFSIVWSQRNPADLGLNAAVLFSVLFACNGHIPSLTVLGNTIIRNSPGEVMNSIHVSEYLGACLQCRLCHLFPDINETDHNISGARNLPDTVEREDNAADPDPSHVDPKSSLSLLERPIWLSKKIGWRGMKPNYVWCGFRATRHVQDAGKTCFTHLST